PVTGSHRVCGYRPALRRDPRSRTGQLAYHREVHTGRGSLVSYYFSSDHRKTKGLTRAQNETFDGAISFYSGIIFDLPVAFRIPILDEFRRYSLSSADALGLF